MPPLPKERGTNQRPLPKGERAARKRGEGIMVGGGIYLSFLQI